MKNPFGMAGRIVAEHQFLERPFFSFSEFREHVGGGVFSGGECSGKSSQLYDLRRKAWKNKGVRSSYLFCHAVDSLERLLMQIWAQPVAQHLDATTEAIHLFLDDIHFLNRKSMALLAALREDSRVYVTATIADHAVNTLDGKWWHAAIPPFTYQDAVSLVDQLMPHNNIPPCILEDAIEDTGGHPGKLQAYLYNVVEQSFHASSLI